ncbi:hypothetical protein [Acinetobacter pittii]|uniref:Phage abortive infection protein n=1 Tax=Acinetobacter pittii TaxID=48296 RepID=A0AB37TIK2_ACIPI|nr:hypothetical protein [Acinetobacter pittii]RSO57962.1 hypothetical protein EA752_13995 [Acinetobacter pittii]
MSDNNQNQQDKIEKWLIPGSIIVIVLIWIIFPWCLSYLTDKFEWSIRNAGDTNFGTFGDTFGALNTLFSGLAFATLIITLFLQRRELELQRKTVKDQQIEIEKSNDIAEQQILITQQQADLLEKQIKEAQVQNFFNILFPLLNRKKTYYEDADELPDAFKTGYMVRGKRESTFKAIHYGIAEIYRNFLTSHGNDFLPKDQILKILDEMLNQSTSLITPYSFVKHTKYLEHFSYVISFIENFKGIDDKDRDVAMSIFLSEFTNRELFVISSFTIRDDLLMEKVVKHKVFKSFIDADPDKKSIFYLLFSE